jgi:hypothetical protein
VAATALLLSGCGGASNDQSSGGSAAVAPAPAGVAGGEKAPSTGGGFSADSSGQGVAPNSSNGKPTENVTIAPQDRAIIYTAEMTVRATNVATSLDKAKQIVTTAGGHVAEEKSSTVSGDSESVITFKIPTDRYPAVLAQLGASLGKRESLHQGTEDVTEQVADVDSRVKSATSALDQFRILLTKANKIGEVLEVEREISTREADLEALQARQKALAAQTSMATITLTLLSPTAAAPVPQDEPSGFLGGLSTGWNALVSAVKVALTILGVLLPWAIVAGVLWLLTLTIMRRGRPRPSAPPSIPPASSTPPGTPSSGNPDPASGNPDPASASAAPKK